MGSEASTSGANFGRGTRTRLLERYAELPPFITVQEAADLLHLSRSTAYRAVARGELPVIRLGGRMRVPVARLLTIAGIWQPAPPPPSQPGGAQA